MNKKLVKCVSGIAMLSLILAGCAQEEATKQVDTTMQTEISHETDETAETDKTVASEGEAPDVNMDKPDDAQEATTEVKTQDTVSEDDKTVDYGDSITFSYKVTEQSVVWEDAGEMTFEVSTDSVQFQNEFDMSVETTMEKVEQAIGILPGESFTIWKEGGDGLYGYEYTVQAIADKPADKVAYGDIIHTTYSMTSSGVDRGDDVITGEQVIHVTNTDEFLARNEINYSVNIAENRIKDILGKGVGDTFSLTQETPEWSDSYEYTITGIDKAVEYGDTIKTTVRRASIMAGDGTSEQKEMTLELLTPKGVLVLDGTELSMEDTMNFLRTVEGTNAGDRVFFITLSDSTRKVYDISITDVIPGESEDAYEMEALMMSTEENTLYFCDDDEQFPIYYAIVKDPENHMIYEYARLGEGDYVSYILETSYSYEAE